MTAAPIYLDYCATTPCDPRVVQGMLPYFTSRFGNTASRDHSFGWMAKEATELAREQVAALVQASARQIVFTSGATEALNLALKGLVEAHPQKGKHIITAKTEHRAVLDTCNWLQEQGCSVTLLDVGADGRIDPGDVEQAIRKDTLCVALMYANNETGVVHPVGEIGAITSKHNVYFVCDATQAVGKVPVSVTENKIDLMAFSAHKLYGPMGVGALYVSHANRMLQQQHGGAHERSMRSGTLNTPGIVGFGMAADICRQEMAAEAKRLRQLRNRLESELQHLVPGTEVNGKGPRLPHVSNILFPGIDNEQLLLAVSGKLALSRGSACSGLVQQPSHVLLAMGLTPEETRRAVRISLGRFTTEEEINMAVTVLSSAVRELQQINAQV
ncbi:IscS subfamily cysteine desulfurase [Chitinophaga alhagiae]|uniref:cysteine desulfurase n=1 Tax=Chitinophaga alhagiae TaxID=2203219 RepID=A0ABM6WDJ4_9BACT|nr:cysteine desulfurase family protein [Chitinophaga alhagiae]AWO02084.1 IscS subfamily cysteine desulfurase [Chitinophaga alhagiae]